MKKYDLDNNEKIPTGFTIPENYWETFETELFDKLDTKPVRKFAFLQSKRVWVPTIAALFLAVIAFPMYFNLSKKSNLDQKTIENYLVQDTKIHTEHLLEHLTEEDIKVLETEMQLTLSDSELELYMNETSFEN